MNRKAEGRRLSKLRANFAPIEGRSANGKLLAGPPDEGNGWNAGDFLLEGKFSDLTSFRQPRTISLNFRVESSSSHGSVGPEARAAADPLHPQAPGWVELEVAAVNQTDPVKVRELFLAGSRPLPEPGITCISRHPRNNGCFVAGTQDGRRFC